MYQNVSVEWQQAAGAGPPAATHRDADLLHSKYVPLAAAAAQILPNITKYDPDFNW